MSHLSHQTWTYLKIGDFVSIENCSNARGSLSQRHLDKQYIRHYNHIQNNSKTCNVMHSNMTSFFRFVNKRSIYWWYNLIRTCTGECDWLFHWQHKLCATFSANVNINYRLPIKVYYRIYTLKTYQNRNKSWKPECVLSFNMGWWILVNFIPRFCLGIKY